MTAARVELLHRKCPLCGRDNRSAPPNAYSPAEWPVKTCAVCGFVYLERVPPYEALSDDLAWVGSMMAERKRRRSKERWLHRISGPLTTFRRNYLQPNKLHHLIHKHFPPGPILDIGCSAGKAIGGVDARFVPFGIEVEVKAAALARERFAARGGRVVEADAIAGLAQFEPSFFTGIVMSSFLEHEANPRAALEGARRVLKTSGGLVVKVPNYACLNRVIRGRRWCGFRFPDHVNYFTPATLTRLLKEEGLEIVRFRFTDRFVTSDTMWLVARKR